MQNELIASIKKELSPPEQEIEALDSRAGLERLFEVIDEREAIQPVRTSYSSRWIGYAAIVAILAVVGISVRYIPNVVPAKHTTSSSVIYTTTFGQRATVTLDGGTRIILAPGTTLRLAGTTAELNGEAAFYVAHRTTSPFSITAHGARITVLGTEFSVRAYDKSVRVAVREGRVSVASRTGVSSVLNVNDVAQVGDTTLAVTHASDVSALFAFTTGNLAFNNTPLADAIADLNRWYDADIRLESPDLGNERFTATLPVGSRADLVEALEFTFKARAVQHGRRITLYRR